MRLKSVGEGFAAVFLSDVAIKAAAGTVPPFSGEKARIYLINEKPSSPGISMSEIKTPGIHSGKIPSAAETEAAIFTSAGKRFRG